MSYTQINTSDLRELKEDLRLAFIGAATLDQAIDMAHQLTDQVEADTGINIEIAEPTTQAHVPVAYCVDIRSKNLITLGQLQDTIKTLFGEEAVTPSADAVIPKQTKHDTYVTYVRVPETS